MRVGGYPRTCTKVKIIIQEKQALSGGIMGNVAAGQVTGALSRWKSIVLLIIEETLVTFFQRSG